MSSLCTVDAPYYGYMGVVFAVALSNVGAAYGTAKAGQGILAAGVFSPDLVCECASEVKNAKRQVVSFSTLLASLLLITNADKNLIPIIMAGVNGIYGLISAIVVLNAITPPDENHNNTYSLHSGFAHLAAGICVGLCGMASGMAIGVAGDAGVRSYAQLDYELKKPKLMSFGAGGNPFRGRGGGSRKKRNPNDLCE